MAPPPPGATGSHRSKSRASPGEKRKGRRGGVQRRRRHKGGRSPSRRLPCGSKKGRREGRARVAGEPAVPVLTQRNQRRAIRLRSTAQIKEGRRGRRELGRRQLLREQAEQLLGRAEASAPSGRCRPGELGRAKKGPRAKICSMGCKAQQRSFTIFYLLEAF